MFCTFSEPTCRKLVNLMNSLVMVSLVIFLDNTRLKKIFQFKLSMTKTKNNVESKNGEKKIGEGKNLYDQEMSASKS